MSIRQATISFHDAAVCSDSSPGDGVDCRLSVIEQNQKTNAQKREPAIAREKDGEEAEDENEDDERGKPNERR